MNCGQSKAVAPPVEHAVPYTEWYEEVLVSEGGVEEAMS